MIERLLRSDELKVWMLRCSYLQKNAKAEPRYRLQKLLFFLKMNHTQPIAICAPLDTTTVHAKWTLWRGEWAFVAMEIDK